MSQAVAIIGAGNMGGGMAANLLAQGWAVHVRDIDHQRTRALAALGASIGATPAAVAAAVAVTIVCVVDAAQTRDVLFAPDGVASGAGEGHAVVLCPTISPQDVEAFAAQLAERGIACIDAPMSGGPARARDGSMSLMVACDDALFERHAALLAALSRKLFRIGTRVGDGARTKLVNNLLAGINLVGAAEVIALARRLGLDAAATLDVIEQSSGQSWIGSDRMRRAVAGDYAPRAHMTLLEKDTGLALDMARTAGFSGPLGAEAHRTFARAHAAGMAALDDAALLRLLEDSRE